MSSTSSSQRVLVTGSSGAIGQPVCRYLQERGHQVRGFDRQPGAELADFVPGDLVDRDQVQSAVSGMDTVIHLAAYPNDADFLAVLLEPNVRGLYHICDAARQAGVKRLVLASSIQVISGHGRQEGTTIHLTDDAKPTNHYALTKVWAETMGEMYARCYQLAVINVRIGWFPRNPPEAQRLAEAAPFGPNVFFSHRDAQRFFACCVEAAEPAPGQAVTVFAASQPSTFPRLDLEPARRILGYEPQDRWPAGLPFAL